MESTISVIAYLLLACAATAFSLFFVFLARLKTRVIVPDQCAATEKTATIVLPCNRKYEQNRQNSIWNAVLTQQLEKQVLFVVESKTDPAYNHIMSFFEHVGLLQQDEVQHFDARTTVQVAVAGLSYHNSQKIHNVLFALGCAKETDAIVCIDDDVQINRFTVPELVRGLDKAKVTTGYSVETPISPKFVDDMIAVYRAINLIAFTREEVQFVWGGMFCIRWKDFVDLKLGQIWADGCYSEDMTLGNICRQLNLKIMAPELCMAINPLPPGHTFIKSYCNYIKRQFYVLLMYMSTDDKWVNRMALFQILYGGLLVWFILGYFVFDLVETYIREWDQQISGSVTSFKIKAIIIVLCITLLGQSINYAITALTKLTNRLEFGNNIHKYRMPAVNRLRTGVAMIAHLALMPIFAFQVMRNKAITWGTTIYERGDGRVSKVLKSGITVDAATSMQQFAETVKNASISGYMIKQRQE